MIQNKNESVLDHPFNCSDFQVTAKNVYLNGMNWMEFNVESSNILIFPFDLNTITVI